MASFNKRCFYLYKPKSKGNPLLILITERRSTMALAGVSTIGIEFGYALETTAGTKPSAFTKLTRINSIGGIDLETEQIDKRI